MLQVGLTGSIAVGKTTVCEIFREMDCHVLDADFTAREVVEPGTEGLRRIIEHFGNGVIQPGGSLNRKALGRIVFSDNREREVLNSIVHPLVIERQDQWLRDVEKTDPDGIAIVDAALMIESGGFRRFNKLIVVWCNAEIQMKRLMERDGLSESAARKRIASQMPQSEKKLYADHLIDTSGSIDETRMNVLSVLEQLKHSSE